MSMRPFKFLYDDSLWADSVAHMDARLKELEALADAAARSLEEEDSFNQGPKSLSTSAFHVLGFSHDSMSAQ